MGGLTVPLVSTGGGVGVPSTEGGDASERRGREPDWIGLD